MAKDFESPPTGEFPDTPPANLGASFGQPAVEPVIVVDYTKWQNSSTKGLGDLGYTDGETAK